MDYDEYRVEFGNENEKSNDITAIKGRSQLIGEVFNVSPSFFQNKITRSFGKMRKQEKSFQKLVIYNSDAVSVSYKSKCRENEFHLKVNLIKLF